MMASGSQHPGGLPGGTSGFARDPRATTKVLRVEKEVAPPDNVLKGCCRAHRHLKSWVVGQKGGQTVTNKVARLRSNNTRPCRHRNTHSHRFVPRRKGGDKATHAGERPCGQFGSDCTGTDGFGAHRSAFGRRTPGTGAQHQALATPPV